MAELLGPQGSGSEDLTVAVKDQVGGELPPLGYRRTAPRGVDGAVRACASTCRTAPARREIQAQKVVGS